MRMKPAAEIGAEFDRIAQTEASGGWNHNNHYHGYLLRHAPAHCDAALEIGCGMGEFARLLAQCSDKVLALDLSPEMLRIARQRSADNPNIEYAQADVMNYPLPTDGFDCIASIATLHHLPLADVLPILKAALKLGGVLLVLDLYRGDGLGDLLSNVVTIPYHLLLQKTRGSHQKPSPESAAAWEAHGRDDPYITINEARRVCADLLPGAAVARRVLWRYSIIWKKGMS